jgi:8-oxo-dGTP diphosphatase
MWLATSFGFFSIVRKSDDTAARTITVRARVKSDLEKLRERYLPQMGPVQTDVGTDYRYRAKVGHADFAIALLRIGLDIDYSNFKDCVAKRQGVGRAHVYGELWHVLLKLQEGEPVSSPESRAGGRTARRVSFGGVLVDRQGRILLRKPRGEFDNYVWTFAKGLSTPGERPEETALREVHEETGYRAEIIEKIPSAFPGGMGSNEYFLMVPLGEPDPFDTSETSQVLWVPQREAAAHIELTRNEKGRKRDLAVLAEAIKTYNRLRRDASD